VCGGSGVEAYRERMGGGPAVLLAPGAAGHYPRAIDLVARVAAGAGRPARPVYCRLPDAEEKRRAREAASG
jgi:hypothetical protein